MQKTTALSTAEAEYYSASTAAAEVLYHHYLLENMGFAQPSPTPVYEDNIACIERGTSLVIESVRSTLISGSTLLMR
jgi:hypothetical protein